MNSVTLEGKKGLVAGIANANSIAYGCAKVFRSLGAELAITYRGAKSEPYVRPLAGELASPIIMPCDVREPGQLEAVFERIRREWGRLDFLLHSIEFASKEDLHSRVVDCSQAGFGLAMDVSCHSFVRMARLAAPLMTKGGTLFAMTYYGSNKVVPTYSVMGPVKAALEASVRYLAYELGPKGIRVCHLAGPHQDARGGRVEGLRSAPQRGRAPGPRRRTGGHRRRRHGHGLPGDPLRPADHGEHGVRRCGIEHHGLTTLGGTHHPPADVRCSTLQAPVPIWSVARPFPHRGLTTSWKIC